MSVTCTVAESLILASNAIMYIYMYIYIYIRVFLFFIIIILAFAIRSLWCTIFGRATFPMNAARQNTTVLASCV